MRTKANDLMKEAADTKLPELTQFTIREWLPYDNYTVLNNQESLKKIAWVCE